MSISPLSNLSSLPLYNTTQTNTSTSATQTPSSISGAGFLAQLQQIEQGSSGDFSQLTSALASPLKDAATKAAASGNTSLADQLNQLVNQFQTASQTGQAPVATGSAQSGHTGHHHHGHHHGAPATTPTTATPTTPGTPTTSNASNELARLLGGFQSAVNSFNPQTLFSTAGSALSSVL